MGRRSHRRCRRAEYFAAPAADRRNRPGRPGSSRRRSSAAYRWQRIARLRIAGRLPCSPRRRRSSRRRCPRCPPGRDRSRSNQRCTAPSAGRRCNALHPDRSDPADSKRRSLRAPHYFQCRRRRVPPGIRSYPHRRDTVRREGSKRSSPYTDLTRKWRSNHARLGSNWRSWRSGMPALAHR
jgi:hypothetical protein